MPKENNTMLNGYLIHKKINLINDLVRQSSKLMRTCPLNWDQQVESALYLERAEGKLTELDKYFEEFAVLIEKDKI